MKKAARGDTKQTEARLTSNVLGPSLAAFRRQQGWTQGQLAKLLGKSNNYVYRIEREDGAYSIPTVEMIRRIVAAAKKSAFEEQNLLVTLLRQREYMVCPEELRARLGDAPAVAADGVSPEPMAHPFLERLAHDVTHLSASKCATIAQELGLPVSKKSAATACFTPILQGQIYLTRSQIVKLAMALGQDADDYLLLAYQLPERMAEIVEHDPTSNFLQVLQRLDPVSSKTLLDLIAMQVEGFRVRQPKS